MKFIFLCYFTFITFVYGIRKGPTRYWKGTFSGVNVSYLLPLKTNTKSNDIVKLYQRSTKPVFTSSLTNDVSCLPVNNVGTCVYSSQLSYGLIKHKDVSQVKVVFDTFQYVNSSANGFQISLDVKCRNHGNLNWANLAVTERYTSDKPYTMIVTITGKCRHTKSRIIDSFRISLKDNQGVEYRCGGDYKKICDPEGLLAKQKCERVDTFNAVFVDMVKDCGVPQEKLNPPILS